MAQIPTRRTILRAALGAAAAAGLAGCSGSDSSDDEASPPESTPASSTNTSATTGTGTPTGNTAQVIVIGAGMSGLTAARQLTDAGYQVIVLEARDRIGGRIWTSRSWSQPLDLGASWIHGTDGNPITALAARAKVKTVETDLDNSTLYTWRGGEAGGAIETAFERWTTKTADAISAFQDESDTDASLRQVVTDRLGWKSLAASDQELVSYALNEIEQEYAGSAATLSALYFDSDEGVTGADVLFPGGYGQLTDFLAKGLQVRTGQVVTAVDASGGGASVTTAQGVYQCEHVIVTVPLGVLKNGSIRFGSALPAAKTTAISSLGMGLLNKCYLQFPEVFWDDTDWLEFIPDARHDGYWSQWVNVARPTGTPILLGFNAADAAHAVESLSDSQTVASAMGTLRTMFGKSIPEPTAFQITRWAKDPFALGSYSFTQVGATPQMRDTLAAAVGRVHFAGEATYKQAPATVHGAHLSGLRAAKEITG